MRIIPETQTKYKFDEISNLGESITDYIIQNVQNEVRCQSEKEKTHQFKQLVKAEERSAKRMDDNEETISKDGITI